MFCRNVVMTFCQSLRRTPILRIASAAISVVIVSGCNKLGLGDYFWCDIADYRLLTDLPRHPNTRKHFLETRIVNRFSTLGVRQL